MKTRILSVLMGTSLVLLTACAQQPETMSHAQDPEAREALAAFPEAEPGYQRHVIMLPQLDDEDQHKVELIGGKTLQVDCNAHGMDGQFDKHDVRGWGYSYWVLQSKAQVRRLWW